MPSAVSALYEPLIARDLESVRKAIEEFRRQSPSDELFLAIARFAVLAYAPSQHAKHAVLAALAAHDVREDLGTRWDELLVECAYYAAASRQPWSEPPIMDPPEPGERGDPDELRAAISERDRLRGERWLALRLDDPDLERDLRTIAAEDPSDDGMKLIITDAAFRLVPILGEKGRYVALRMAIWEMTAYGGETEPAPRRDDLNSLIERCIADNGSLESAHAVFRFAAEFGAPVSSPAQSAPVPIYKLGRDMAATLIAHAVVKRLRPLFPDANFAGFLDAVQRNLETAPSLEDWSFA